MKFSLLLSALVAGTLTACSSSPPPNGLEVYQAYDRPIESPRDGSQVRVVVSLSRQRAYLMEGDQPLFVMPVSVGSEATPTPTGTFRIREKEERRRSTTEGFAVRQGSAKKVTRRRLPSGSTFVGRPLPYWCGWTPKLGFHTGWIKHEACTDGCIRMHENLAPKFFAKVRVGTPVEISVAPPEDLLYGTIPLPPDAGPLPDYPVETYLGDGYFDRHR
ncbi:lipoprotein-anchoring transpeptidase ErfK/SrfK [Haloferula luteola]|uniref:Lipoprotein-anchoring transpeptidase ErfK/SrfK n=1 Tax=Haloferula luteola TaxID=595692 RepID=A0A840V304_9BACT|nr:L,D-transpeptidase [Haloferula luteola]MBB5352375.1 lipoprotein-anchoring transpeptidase ErfK/SrfK [Haloferula luteola]